MIENKIPEALLDLLMVVFLYINSKSEDKNPFIRTFGDTGEEESYKLLIQTANEASYLFGEVEKLNKTRMEKEKKEEELFIKQQQEEDIKVG